MLDGGRVDVPADVADKGASRRRVVVPAERVPEAARPDRVDVRSGAVVVRVVERDRPVLVDPEDLPPGAGQKLRVPGRGELVAGREQDRPVVGKHDRPGVMVDPRVARVLIQHDLAARDRAGPQRVGGEARETGSERAVGRIYNVEVVIRREVRVDGDVHQPLNGGRAVCRGDVADRQEGRRTRLRVGRRQHPDGAANLADEHSPVGQEREARRHRELGGEDLVLEHTGVRDVDRDRIREGGVRGGVPSPRCDRVGSVRDEVRVPRHRVRSRGVLAAGRHSVDVELDAGHADVVRCGCRQGRHVL